ncbi:MFS transporter [Candidatus Saccharibacteria bacterium]|nr:MFS transporter [Candidatus Saccharibacteria bacterium]
MNEDAHAHKPYKTLAMMHVFNDGYAASFLLLLPFIARSLHLNLTEVGVLGGVINFAALVVALPISYVAARLGGLRIVIIAQLLYGLALAGLSFAGNFGTLLVAFVLAGLGFGVFHPIAFALIARWTPKEKRGRAIGTFTAIGDLGRIGIAAAVSFIAVRIGWGNTALLYATVPIVISGVLIFGRWRARGSVSAPPHHANVVSMREVLKNVRLIAALAASWFDTFASKALFVFLPFLLLHHGVSATLLGAYTGIFFVGNFLGKFFMGRLVDRVGNVQVFISAEILMAVLIVVLALFHQPVVITIAALLLGTVTKGTTPVRQTMISEASERHGAFEKSFGVSAVVEGSGDLVAPIVLGVVGQHYGIVSAFWVMAGVALLATIPAAIFHSRRATN